MAEGTAFDDGGFDAGVQDGHERQRLHHVRAVVAAQAHVNLEVKVAFDGFDLVEQVLLFFGWVATRPQQGQHQRGEFMAQRQASKAQTAITSLALQGERGFACVVAIFAQGDFVAAQALDGGEQLAHLRRSLALVQGGHQLERLGHALQVGGQLGFELCIEHGSPPKNRFFEILGDKKPDGTVLAPVRFWLRSAN